MTMSPQEIQAKQFHVRFRGFNLVPTLLRGNAYLRDEHFITSSFEEVA